MNLENEKWKEEALESMLGSKRAEPNPLLFQKIKDQIRASDTDILKTSEIRLFSTIFAIILLLNVILVIFLKQKEQKPKEHLEIAELHKRSLINTFQIYE